MQIKIGNALTSNAHLICNLESVKQPTQFDAHLACLKLADHETSMSSPGRKSTILQVTSTKTDPVRLENGSIPKIKEDLLKGCGEYFASLLNNRNANIDPANKPKHSIGKPKSTYLNKDLSVHKSRNRTSN